MITRSKDENLLTAATEPYRDMTFGFDPKTWLSNEDNIALSDDIGNFGLLEFEIPGIYTGHWFLVSKGQIALKTAADMISEAFTHHPVEVIRGLTPVDKLPARWFTRKLGFRSYGEVETLAGWCELFILTRTEWNGFSNREE